MNYDRVGVGDIVIVRSAGDSRTSKDQLVQSGEKALVVSTRDVYFGQWAVLQNIDVLFHDALMIDHPSEQLMVLL